MNEGKTRVFETKLKTKTEGRTWAKDSGKSLGTLFLLSVFLILSSYLSTCKILDRNQPQDSAFIRYESNFETAKDFIQDESGTFVAKDQIIVALKADSEKVLEEKLNELKRLINEKGWRTGGIVHLYGRRPSVILQIIGDFKKTEDIHTAINEMKKLDGEIIASPNTKLEQNYIKGAEIPPDPLFDSWDEVPAGNNWHFEYMNFPKAWKEQSVGKVKVGFIEFGFGFHEDLPHQKISYRHDEQRSYEAVEHGISVVGVLGAKGANGKGIAGAVWRWSDDGGMIIEIIDGTIAGVVQGILSLVDKVKVILFAGGIKWNSDPSSNPKAQEILAYHREIFSLVFQYVKFYDVVFVQSAGNEGIDAIWAGVGTSVKDVFPGNIIIVGSAGNGYISGFSNFGEVVDVYAPGESIFTLCADNSYCLKSGTSYSAALVAGLATLIRSARPDLKAQDVKNAIMLSMRKKRDVNNLRETEGDLSHYIPDAYTALLIAKEITPTAAEEEVVETLPYIPPIDVFKGGPIAPKAVVCANFDNTANDGDRAFYAPKCPFDVEICSSCDLLKGRDNVSGFVEPNQPNVISTCPGADSPGTVTGRIESIRVEAIAETGFFEANRPLTQAIKVVVQAYCTSGNDFVDILTTVNADLANPTWIYFNSSRCNVETRTSSFYCNAVASSGWKTCVAFVVLPANIPSNRSLAIRARYQNSGTAQTAGCYTASTVRDHDDLVFKAQTLPTSFQCATYNATLSAPICSDAKRGWCGTCGIARCRGTTVTSGENVAGFMLCGAGTPTNPSEPGTPNTVYNTCTDTNEDDYNAKDEEIRKVNIKSLAPSGLFEGNNLVDVSVTVFCYPYADQIVFHYASGITTSSPNVNWRHISSVYCPSGGAAREPFILNNTIQLDNAEGWHAIRATVIFTSSYQTSACPNITYRDADDIIFYVKAVPPSALPVCASFDATTSDGDPAYRTPKCPGGASQCSTCDLVKSRDNISTPEPNYPNTLSTAPACPDSTAPGTYLQTESIERVEIMSSSGVFTPGATAQIRVLVNCNIAYPTYLYDRLRVLYSSNANNPTWTVIEENKPVCSGPGYSLYTRTITLASVGGNHVVRAMFQQGDFSNETCATGTNGDTDDLVFTVGVPQAPQNFDVVGVAPDSMTLSWNDVAGETYYELRWTDTYNADFSVWITHHASPLPANSYYYVDRPLPEGTYRCYALRACNANGCSSFVWDCDQIPGESAVCGTYDSNWKVPVCPGGVNNCSTCTLVVSRDGITPRSELNTPNTWQNSCVDQGGGTYYGTGNSIEKITLFTSASSFQLDYPISVTVRVYCATAGTPVGAYYSSSTSPLSFVSIGTTTCTGSSRVEDKTFSFTPTTAGWHVVRAVMGAAAVCSTVSQFEADDLAVRIGEVPPVPSGFDVFFVEPSTARAVWNDVTGETYYRLVSAPKPSDPFTHLADLPANTTVYNHPLGPGQTICFRVAACNSLGCSTYTAAKCTARPPLPPSNLVVTAVTEGSNPTTFTVTFTDNSTNEDGFVIDRIGAGDASWTRVEWWSNATTKAEIGVRRSIVFTLTTERTFCFRVASFVQVPGAGTLSLSAWADGVTRCLVAPAVPGAFEVSFEDFGSSVAAVLSWTDLSSYETGYVVMKGTQSFVMGPTTSSYIDGAVSEGTTYTYSVSAYYSGTNVFAYGKTLNYSIYGVLRPTPLYVEPETSVIKVSWLDRSGVEDEYSIERSVNGGSWAQISVVPLNSSFYLDSLISPNTRYCYRVRARKINPSAFSGYSEIKCVSTASDGASVGSISFGTGEISVISASGSGGRVYVGTTTGYIYLISITDLSPRSSFNAGGQINGLCVKEYGRAVTLIAVTSGGLVYKLDRDLLNQGVYNAGSSVFGCAVSDSVYITTSSRLARLRLSDLGLITSRTISGISSGPILTSSLVYYLTDVVGGKKICWASASNLEPINCSTTYLISSQISADGSGVYAGTSDGKMIFVSHSGSTFSYDLTSPAENITGTISVYNRGAQKLLGISTQGGRFYLVEVTKIPPYDGLFETKVLWWKNIGSGQPLSSSLMQSEYVSVGNSQGDIYTYRITDGNLVFSNTVGASPIRTSPLSLDGFVFYGEGANIRIISGGKSVPENSWSRVGGNLFSDNLYTADRIIVGLREKFVMCTEDSDYVVPTPVSHGSSIYYGFSSAQAADFIFVSSSDGGYITSRKYQDSSIWITSNISIGDVLGDEAVEVGLAMVNLTGNQPGYINILYKDLSSVFEYRLPATLKYVRGLVLHDIVGGDGGKRELAFVAYFPRAQRSRLYILDPDNPNPLVCSRDFGEHIWSMPLIAGENLVIGGGGVASSGNLYVLKSSSCDIIKTISFSGHLKEGYLTDVNKDGLLDWVGGLTQPDGGNYAVFVLNVFGSHSISTVHLGTLSEIAGKNNIRGIVPIDTNSDGTFESAFFVETAQLRQDNVRWSYLSVVRFSQVPTLLWRRKLDFWVFSSPVVGDFDGGRSRKEVIVAGWDGGETNAIFMLDAESGAIKQFYPIALRNSETVGAHGLYISDVDSDGYLDLMVGGSRGCFYLFSFGIRSNWLVDVKMYRKDETLNAVW